jgi:hypothetical protein
MPNVEIQMPIEASVMLSFGHCAALKTVHISAITVIMSKTSAGTGLEADR